MIFVLTLFLLIVVHELGHFIVARSFGVKIERFSFGFGRALAKIKDKHGTVYTIGWIPLGGYVKMLSSKEKPQDLASLPHAFETQSLMKRFLIVLSGPCFNFLFAWLCLFIIFIRGYPLLPPIIGKVFPHSPASYAHLLPGDKILSVNNRPFQDWFSLTNFVQQHAQTDLKIAYLRHQKMHTIRIKTETKNHRGYLGLLPQSLKQNKQPILYVHPPVYEAIKNAAYETIDLIRATAYLFYQLFSGKLSLNHLSGPLGIAEAASTTAHQSLNAYLFFLALVSVSLGVVNLLPIPMLDGGHLLFFCIEAILKKPLSEQAQNTALKVGISLLMFFMIFALSNDISRWSHS